MSDFWEKSWQELQPERLETYIHHFDLAPDSLIRELHSRGVTTVCDGGCGCGIYSLKLAANGFCVEGFDISLRAAEIASALLQQAGFSANFRQASVLDTGYDSDTFDCVICRDVVDHIPKADGFAAIRELLRITRPGGLVFFTLDSLGAEYEAEPHQVSPQGDYQFTHGKWKGMVFHPYSAREFQQLIPAGADFQMENWEDGLLVCIKKSV